jgi:YHS domain-containing protein
MMRQIRKQILTIALLTPAFAVVFGAMTPAVALTSTVVTAIVSNPLTGIAIDGYDPVSFFTDSEPKQGRSEFEFVWGGVPWYFVSEANRVVFMAHPEIYAPQFGGHCAMSAARGYLSDGNPRIYRVIAQKLYFFYSSGNREAFLMAPAKAVDEAKGHWGELSKDLSSQ